MYESIWIKLYHRLLLLLSVCVYATCVVVSVVISCPQWRGVYNISMFFSLFSSSSSERHQSNIKGGVELIVPTGILLSPLGRVFSFHRCLWCTHTHTFKSNIKKNKGHLRRPRASKRLFSPTIAVFPCRFQYFFEWTTTGGWDDAVKRVSIRL